MLVLTRKTSDSIVIDGRIRIEVLQIQRGGVRLGIVAPREVSIRRGELVASESQSDGTVACGPRKTTDATSGDTLSRDTTCRDTTSRHAKSSSRLSSNSLTGSGNSGRESKNWQGQPLPVTQRVASIDRTAQSAAVDPTDRPQSASAADWDSRWESAGVRQVVIGPARVRVQEEPRAATPTRMVSVGVEGSRREDGATQQPAAGLDRTCQRRVEFEDGLIQRELFWNERGLQGEAKTGTHQANRAADANRCRTTKSTALPAYPLDDIGDRLDDFVSWL